MIFPPQPWNRRVLLTSLTAEGPVCLQHGGVMERRTAKAEQMKKTVPPVRCFISYFFYSYLYTVILYRTQDSKFKQSWEQASSPQYCRIITQRHDRRETKQFLKIIYKVCSKARTIQRKRDTYHSGAGKQLMAANDSKREREAPCPWHFSWRSLINRVNGGRGRGGCWGFSWQNSGVLLSYFSQGVSHPSLSHTRRFISSAVIPLPLSLSLCMNYNHLFVIDNYRPFIIYIII